MGGGHRLLKSSGSFDEAIGSVASMRLNHEHSTAYCSPVCVYKIVFC